MGRARMRTRAPKNPRSLEEECLARGSLFEFLAHHLEEIATEEVVGGIFSEERGRGSTPPEHLVALLMLRYFERVSYQVASDRARYDVRWKAVLGVPHRQLGPVVSDTTLNDFEKALRENGRFEKLLSRTVVLAKEAGVFGEEVEAAQVSSPGVGRGAVQDTYNLLGTSIRKRVRAIAKEQGEPARAVAKRYGVEDLFDRSTKATADIDWSDREARRRFLQRLVETAKRLVADVDPRERWGVAAGVVEAMGILQKVLGQDIEVGADGRVSLRQGVAEDRLISVHDPEMRRGHKTQSEAFEGYKFHITVEVEHGFVLATEVTGANVRASAWPSARRRRPDRCSPKSSATAPTEPRRIGLRMPRRGARSWRRSPRRRRGRSWAKSTSTSISTIERSPAPKGCARARRRSCARAMPSPARSA